MASATIKAATERLASLWRRASIWLSGSREVISSDDSGGVIAPHIAIDCSPPQRWNHRR